MSTNSTVSDMFGAIAKELVKNCIHAEKITPENVFQAANLKNRALVNKIMEYLVLPGSSIENQDVLVKLGQLSKEGKSCLILMEHYSNFDIPTFFWLMEKPGAQCQEIASQIIAMAGMKLNEEEAFVRAFTEAYSRIVIYPSRSIEKLYLAGESQAEEMARARSINRAALHNMVRRKHEGHVILVFPSGTRYRPGEPETKKGLREMDSYIKSFDHLLFIGTAGNCLQVNSQGAMSQDIPVQDLMVFQVDDMVMDSKDFRESVPVTEGVDPKQAAADAIMARLDMLHERAETIRTSRLKKA